MSQFRITLILFPLIPILFGKEELFDYEDRTCDSHQCFLAVIKSYGDCKLSADKQLCQGIACKFIGNSNTKMCVNPTELSEQNVEELERRLFESSVSIASQWLCLYDDDNNVYDTLCKKMGGIKCHPSSQKCVMKHEQYAKIDANFEMIRKDHHTLYQLPYDYTNNLLLVIDGTSTKEQFEADGLDAIKGGEYKMKGTARWENGNWANHPSNFFGDYKGAKYYWYGPDNSAQFISAASECKGLAEGAAHIICRFIGNHTDIDPKEINIDLVGYSRGGYTIMETVRKLDRDGCPDLSIKSPDIHIRFMGLYDPVSSTLSYSDGELQGNMISGLFGDKGLFVDQDINYEYKSDIMPPNVDHIVISYGDPALGSRAYFNTCDEDEDKLRDNIERNYYLTTHGGIGGTPMDGDYEMVKEGIQDDGWQSLWGFKRWMYGNIVDGIQHVEGYGAEMECQQSMMADMFIRNKAFEYGLPIDKTNEDYYHFYRCPRDNKES